MYSLATLLNDEPEKLERLFIKLLKFIIAIFIAISFTGSNFSLSDFADSPFKDLALSGVLQFTLALILVWVFVWNILAELILGQLLIIRLSKIGNKRDIYKGVLGVLDIIKGDTKSTLPGKNIVAFNNFLQSYSEEHHSYILESKIRVREYFILLAAIYLCLLFAPAVNLPKIAHWATIIIIMVLLFFSVISQQIYSYLDDNIDDLKRQFSSMAYSQMVFSTITRNTTLTFRYNIDKNGILSKIKLYKKDPIHEDFPDTIIFYTFSYWNNLLEVEVFHKSILSREEKIGDRNEGKNHWDVIVSKVEPTMEQIKSIENQSKFAYLVCKDEQEMYKNIEVLIYRLTKGRFLSEVSVI